jgi:putative chitinase
MKLTEHFSLEELWHSDTAVRMGIDNRPPPIIVDRLHELAVGLEKIRAVLGLPLLVNSGYRCEELEWVICAKDYSAWCARRERDADEAAWAEYFKTKGHPQGYCGDFTCSAFGAPRRIVRAVFDSGIRFDQIIEEGTWVHASFDPRMRHEALTATFKDGVPSYSRGIG